MLVIILPVAPFARLGEAAATPVLSFIKHFRPEFEYYIQHGKSMVEGTHNVKY